MTQDVKASELVEADDTVIALLTEAVRVGHEKGIDLFKGRISQIATVLDRITSLEQTRADLLEALRPFAQSHFMGDLYVKFAPRLLEAARAAISRAEGEGR